MTYLSHWSFDPFLVIAVLLAAWNETGVRRLCRRAAPERARKWRLRSYFFYGSLLVLLLAVESPIDYYADQYFFVHMIEHLLLMFAAPSLLVAGAPWLPFAWGLPVSWRRRVGRELLVAPWSAPLRSIGRALIKPMVAIVGFNAVMVIWHLPVLFDLAENNQTVHIWLMHGSFFVFGVAFWLQFIRSYPFAPRLSPGAQIGALLATNVVMVVLAMALSILASDSWYSVYSHVPGVTLNPFADQQIGAAIIWVCGDFWAFPALVVAFRRLQEQPEGIEGAFERFMRREARLGPAGMRTPERARGR